MPKVIGVGHGSSGVASANPVRLLKRVQLKVAFVLFSLHIYGVKHSYPALLNIFQLDFLNHRRFIADIMILSESLYGQSDTWSSSYLIIEGTTIQLGFSRVPYSLTRTTLYVFWHVCRFLRTEMQVNDIYFSMYIRLFNASLKILWCICRMMSFRALWEDQ